MLHVHVIGGVAVGENPIPTVMRAVERLHRRRDGLELPHGFMRKGRWYPCKDEKRDCCRGLPRNPGTRYLHCCELEHVLQLEATGQEHPHIRWWAHLAIGLTLSYPLPLIRDALYAAWALERVRGNLVGYSEAARLIGELAHDQ